MTASMQMSIQPAKRTTPAVAKIAVQFTLATSHSGENVCKEAERGAESESCNDFCNHNLLALSNSRVLFQRCILSLLRLPRLLRNHPAMPPMRSP